MVIATLMITLIHGPVIASLTPPVPALRTQAGRSGNQKGRPRLSGDGKRGQCSRGRCWAAKPASGLPETQGYLPSLHRYTANSIWRMRLKTNWR